MKLTNLQARPDKYLDTMSLIERSFNYSDENSFAVDFYPLVNKSNWQNCWIILDDDKVIGHSGCVRRSFKVKDKLIDSIFIGAVAVDQNHRGQGLSTKLLNHILESYSDVAFHILWSEKLELYKKLGFLPCVELYEIDQKQNSTSFVKAMPAELSSDDLEDIKRLYQNSKEYRVLRTDKDWKDVFQIKSSSLYIKREQQKITNYFFINKGQDLSGVIHEYGHLEDLSEMRVNGKIWASQNIDASSALFGCLIKPGNLDKFKQALNYLTDSKIKLTSINDQVQFSFESTEFSLSIEEFMQGVLGPNRFEELSGCPPIFISGLDSI
ncbi:MAG: GNAT family N-acetyltransferase [Bacteriovoracaceae bacterium]|nr:GNAT family N-acetyltransferase [Bacteriovoracaceae bacterium]